MATITDLNSTDNGSISRGVINTNFDNLNTDLITAQGNITTIKGNITNVQSDITALELSKIEVFNVKSYGAVGDGTTDDTVAVNLAISAITTAGGAGILYFPTGIYRLTSALSFVDSGATKSQVSIYGDGQSQTELKFDANVNGIVIDNSNVGAGVNCTYTLRDFSVTTTQTSADKTGISYTGVDEQGNGLSMERVTVRGSGTAPVTTYWKHCVALTTAFYVDIRNCWFQGVPSDRTLCSSGIRFLSTGANARLVGNSYYFLNVGVSNTTGQAYESLYISDSQFVQCSYGVYWGADGNHLVVEGCHMEVSNGGVSTINGNDDYGRFCSISNNFILITGSIADKKGFYINSNFCAITGNTVMVAGDATNASHGIILAPYAKYCVVSGNIFFNCTTTGILIQAGATSNKVIGNAGTSNGTDLTDGGITTTTSGNF